MAPVDIVIVLVGGLAGNVVFNNFEKHLPWWRRLAKFIALVVALAIVGALFGRAAFYAVLAVLALGQAVLHLWWFPKHGINGLTAEPYDKYLELIARMKRGQR